MKKYHFAIMVDERGKVIALCFRYRRPINLRIASWTLRKDAVTCKKCLRILEASHD
jgi:hypothetical protein